MIHQYCPYLGTRVSSVPCPGQRRTYTSTRLQALPRGRSKAHRAPSPKGRSGPDRTWGTSLPHDRCHYTGSPIKSLAQTASKLTPAEGVTRSNRLSSHCHTSPVLHRHDIDRSEPIRQHEVKPIQCDDGHARLISGRDHVATV
jgi:hypothetical protein